MPAHLKHTSPQKISPSITLLMTLFLSRRPKALELTRTPLAIRFWTTKMQNPSSLNQTLENPDFFFKKKKKIWVDTNSHKFPLLREKTKENMNHYRSKRLSDNKKRKKNTITLSSISKLETSKSMRENKTREQQQQQQPDRWTHEQ